MGRPCNARRRARRALERAERAEYVAECRAAGWIRRHPRAPHSGQLFLLGGGLWYMVAYSITPPGLLLTNGQERMLVPVEDWASRLAYDPLTGRWGESPEATNHEEANHDTIG